MSNEIEKKISSKMKKSIFALKSELSKIRTGRAHPSLLDHITVEHYGSKVPLSQVANITIEDTSTLLLNVWEKHSVENIEKAIANADLGLNPAVSGVVVRIPIPSLTEDRRKDLIKVVRQHGEMAKISLRNIRRDANQHIKDALKAKEISQDQEKTDEKRVQNLTDQYISEIDEVLAEKEKELMVV